MTLTDPVNDGWLFEAGIGEDRAALVKNGHIVEAHIERHGGVKAGLIAKAKLVKILGAKNRAIVTLIDGGGDAILSPVPASVTEGQELTVVITREAIAEKSREKLPWAKHSDAEPASAPSLYARIAATGAAITECFGHQADHLGNVGWHDLVEQAQSGIVAFAGGTLEITVTPAMTLIDIDGDLDSAALCHAGADAAAQAIRRLRLSGSIGIDFPDVATKSARAQVADIFDAAMKVDCERTAVNGFGFMQIVTRRMRLSLPELLQRRRNVGHTLELLRRAERDGGAGPMEISAHPAIASIFDAHEDWMLELSRRTGRSVTLQINPKLSIGGGYAASG